eukprot:gene37533-46305_t
MGDPIDSKLCNFAIEHNTSGHEFNNCMGLYMLLQTASIGSFEGYYYMIGARGLPFESHDSAGLNVVQLALKAKMKFFIKDIVLNAKKHCPKFDYHSLLTRVTCDGRTVLHYGVFVGDADFFHTYILNRLDLVKDLKLFCLLDSNEFTALDYAIRRNSSPFVGLLGNLTVSSKLKKLLALE